MLPLVAQCPSQIENCWTGFYDLDNTLTSILVLIGLEGDAYQLDDWRTILAITGFPNDNPPDQVAQTDLRWDDLGGYYVRIGEVGIEDGSNVFIFKQGCLKMHPCPQSRPGIRATSRDYTVRIDVSMGGHRVSTSFTR